MDKQVNKKIQRFDNEEEREINIQVRKYILFYKMRNGHEPSEKLVEKERKRIIKKNFSNDKTGMRQTEKEHGQMDCLLGLLKREGKHLSLEEMSEYLVNSGFTVGSSVKTIYRRILPQLLNNGALKDNDGKYYIPSFRRSPEIEKRIETLISEEIEVISMISNFLETLKGTPVYEKAKAYIDRDLQHYRVRKNSRENKKTDENLFVSRVIFMGAPAADIKNEIWEMLNSAMMENKHVSILYTAEGKKKAEKYTVQPYQLIFDDGLWELWGMCTNADHKGRRLFNLSRISDVELLEKGEPFILPENYDFRNTLAGNFGCYNDDVVENYSIKIKKDSYAYLYIKDRVWGEFQELKKVKDGYILEFEATQYLPILRWVLGWGPEVEPLEPEKLVNDWKEKIREMGKVL